MPIRVMAEIGSTADVTIMRDKEHMQFIINYK